MEKYDYLIVGSGLFGAVCAHRISQMGKKAIVIEKRAHPGGNIYCEKIAGIDVHAYGAHIFHTSNKEVWDFVNRFVGFNRYTNSPLAHYEGKLYNLPFNMNTFYQLWGTLTPAQAMQEIEKQRAGSGITNPRNLEEQALMLVGKDIYEKLIKGYTEKQWGRSAKELPAFIIKRLPVRFTFDNNYFNDTYQGIPVEGYNTLIDKLLGNTEVLLSTDFFSDRERFKAMAGKIIFTGMIDEYFSYCFGPLEYRSLRFEHELLETDNFQGNAVVNYTHPAIPYTRIIEHKHFMFGTQPQTVITKEYPQEWNVGDEPYYPVNDRTNESLYEKYRGLADREPGVVFGGRLGAYKYYDMHQVVENALSVHL